MCIRERLTKAMCHRFDWRTQALYNDNEHGKRSADRYLSLCMNYVDRRRKLRIRKLNAAGNIP